MSEQTVDTKIHNIKVYEIKLEEGVTDYKIRAQLGNVIDVVNIPGRIGIVIQHSKRWTDKKDYNVTVLREGESGYIKPSEYFGYVDKRTGRYFVYIDYGREHYPLGGHL